VVRATTSRSNARAGGCDAVKDMPGLPVKLSGLGAMAAVIPLTGAAATACCGTGIPALETGCALTNASFETAVTAPGTFRLM
jgi:hypothetical protein